MLPVNPLTTYVRSLGNAGALANARTVLDAHRHEDWLIQGLARRLEGIGPETLSVVKGTNDAATMMKFDCYVNAMELDVSGEGLI